MEHRRRDERRIAGQGELGEPVEHRLEGDRRLDPAERGAHAVVDAVAEGDVAIGVVTLDVDHIGIVVRDIREAHEQPAVVEEIVKGREIRVSLLGNENLECLPLLEYSPGPDGKICPAPPVASSDTSSCGLRNLRQ